MRKNSPYMPLYIAVSFIPAIIILYYINTYGVNFPFWDQWEIPNLFIKAQSSSLTFQDIFSQHNEHRVVFPKLIVIALTFLLSSWNIKAEILLGFLIVLGTHSIIIALAWKGFSKLSFEQKDTRQVHLLEVSLLFSSLLLFSTIQHENWLWGFQFTWFLIIFILLASILFISLYIKSKNWIYYALAILFTFIASFSSAHGLIIWIACFPMFFTSLLPLRKKLIVFCIWTFSFVLTSYFYFFDYTKPVNHPSSNFIFENPGYATEYFFNLVGRSLDKEIKPKHRALF